MLRKKTNLSLLINCIIKNSIKEKRNSSILLWWWSATTLFINLLRFLYLILFNKVSSILFYVLYSQYLFFVELFGILWNLSNNTHLIVVIIFVFCSFFTTHI